MADRITAEQVDEAYRWADSAARAGSPLMERSLRASAAALAARYAAQQAASPDAAPNASV